MSEETAKVTPISAIRIASKRCTKCGIHPKPSDMVMLWGYNWETETVCLSCKRQRGATAVVIEVPKLARFASTDIKEWYVPVKLREFARKTYMNTDNFTKVYLTDGKDRFWAWNNWPYMKDNPVKLEDFERAFPNWQLIEPPEEGVYPEMRSYIGC